MSSMRLPSPSPSASTTWKPSAMQSTKLALSPFARYSSQLLTGLTAPSLSRSSSKSSHIQSWSRSNGASLASRWLDPQSHSSSSPHPSPSSSQSSYHIDASQSTMNCSSPVPLMSNSPVITQSGSPSPSVSRLTHGSIGSMSNSSYTPSLSSSGSLLFSTCDIGRTTSSIQTVSALLLTLPSL